MPVRDTAWPNGTPCWIDYTAIDLPAAQQLYAEVLGWTFTEGQPEYGGYLTCLRQDRPAAGMAPQMSPDEPAHWTTYFAADDADDAVKRIDAAGGTVVVPPMQVGDMGRMVVALDPQGHAFGLWESGQHTGVEVYNEPGSLVWNEVAAPDPESAAQFYSSVFDYRFEEMEGSGGYRTFATGDQPLGGLGGVQPGMPVGWTVCFAVADTDASVAAVERRGGSTLMAAQDTPYGRVAVLQDPWGAAFSVMQVAEG